MAPKSNDKKHAVCFLETHASWVSRLKADNEDSFMQLFSEATMQAQYDKKPLGNIKIKFLENHIEFKNTGLLSSKPPRNTLTYEQIERFITTQEQPLILNLGVKDGQNNAMTCEMIKFKTEKQVNQACDLIQKARQNPNFRLVADDSLNMLSQLSRISQSSLNIDTDSQHRSTLNGGKVEMVENEDYLVENYLKNGHESTHSKRPKSTRPLLVDHTKIEKASSIHYSQSAKLHSDCTKKTNEKYVMRNESHLGHSVLPKTEEISYKARAYQPLRNWRPEDIKTMKEDLVRTVQDGSAWTVDVKTIETHPIHGNKISDNGSIFMFIAHMIPEEQRAAGYSACSSSTDSLNSIEPRLYTNGIPN